MKDLVKEPIPILDSKEENLSKFYDPHLEIFILSSSSETVPL